MTPTEVRELSDVHLLYMGPGHFAEIKKIHAPVPGPPTSCASQANKGVTPNNFKGVMPNCTKKPVRKKKVTNRGDKKRSQRVQTPHQPK